MNGLLVVTARRYLGVKFRHRGRSTFSLDCAGLLVRSYADNGVTLVDIPLYGNEPFRDGLYRHCEASFGPPVAKARVDMSSLQDGDIVLMRFRTQPHHLGIIAAANYGGTETFNIIHADGNIGRVLEQRFTPDMATRITHLFRRPL